MPTAIATPSNWRHSRSPGGTRESASDRRVKHQPSAGKEEQRAKAGTWQHMRGHVVAVSGELVGTVLFLWFAFAGNQTASQSTPVSTVLEPQGIMFNSPRLRYVIAGGGLGNLSHLGRLLQSCGIFQASQWSPNADILVHLRHDSVRSPSLGPRRSSHLGADCGWHHRGWP